MSFKMYSTNLMVIFFFKGRIELSFMSQIPLDDLRLIQLEIFFSSTSV